MRMLSRDDYLPDSGGSAGEWRGKPSIRIPDLQVQQPQVHRPLKGKLVPRGPQVARLEHRHLGAQKLQEKRPNLL